MRPLLVALLLLAPFAAAEDLVHLRHGGTLSGRIVAERAGAVVLEIGAGRVTVPRDRIRLVERLASPRGAGRRTVERDEWSLVHHGGDVVGWRRVVHTARPGAIRVEEQTVFFRSGESEEIDIRRVEVEDEAGRPVEFLHMERYGSRMEVVSGEANGAGAFVQVRRDGTLENRSLELPQGWRLALPAWSRFLATADDGEIRTILALDPRTLRMQEFVMRRQPDRAAPAVADLRPCRAIELTSAWRSARAFYRPGEGAVAEELNGPTLIARRASRAKVELARRAHAPPDPLTVERLQRHPLQRAASSPATCFHLSAGLAITPPEGGWVAEARGAGATGRLLAFEKIEHFASFELFAYPAEPSLAPADCLARALRRLRLAATEATCVGGPEERQVAGRPALVQQVRTLHRGEDLCCLLAVIPAQGRYIVAVGAAPERYWPRAAPAIAEFLRTLELAD